MPMIHRQLFALVLILAFVPATRVDANPKGERLATLLVEGRIEVDPTGKVASHVIEPAIPSAISEPLSRTIAQWRFEPPAKHGATTNIVSPMRIGLAGQRRKDGNYEVRVDNVMFPVMSVRTSESKPRKKRVYLSLPVNAAVFAHVLVSPEGKVLDASVAQCSLLAKSGFASAGAICGKLKAYVLWQIEAMQFELAKKEEKPIALVLPVHYRGDPQTPVFKQGTGKWRAEWRMTYPRPDWVKSRSRTFSPSEHDAPMQHSSDLRLLEGATGQAL